MPLLLPQILQSHPIVAARFTGLEKVAFDADPVPMLGCVLVTALMAACIVRWVLRGVLLKRAATGDVKFAESFSNSAHVLAMLQNGESVPGSPRSALYTNASRELAFHLLGTDSVDKGFAMRLRAAGRITPMQWQAVQRAARRSWEESARWIRSGLTGAGVKALPSLGLAFTILAFIDHAGDGSLSLLTAASSLRPLALALICHAIGTIWHRNLTRLAEDAVADLEDFASELGMLFERNFVDHQQPIETLPSLGTIGMSDSPGHGSAPIAETSRAMAH